jgi:flagellar motility protein MotE (MotC chaperone)
MGTVRLLQLVAFAAFCLLVLKTAGLMLSGGYVLSGAAPANAQTATAAPEAPEAGEQPSKSSQPSAEDAGDEKAAQSDGTEGKKTGADGEKPTAKNGEKPSAEDGRLTDAFGAEESGPGKTESELAVLQSLSKRRIELERRQRELELRENLLKAAEKRVGARIAELKSIEKRIEKELSKQDDESMAQYMRLVKMYAAMKPKQAAQIFNRLDLDILTAMVQRMRPQAMAKILAAMDPSAARRLTMELARSSDVQPGGTNKLPKIGQDSAG